MRVKIEPSAPRGTVFAPPSKSMAHRCLFAAALADGVSVIENVPENDDVLATLDCLGALGIRTVKSSDRFNVHGQGGNFTPLRPLDCRESGSTLRFLIPLCFLPGREATLTGSERLFERDLGVYETIAADRGLTFRQNRNILTVGGALRGGDFVFPGDVSSQFVTGLLFRLPTLEEDSRIVLTGRVESKPYIDMTLEALGEFGVRSFWQGENALFVPGGQIYHPGAHIVEGDWSNAAFLFALLSAHPESEADVRGIKENTLQGDSVCLRYFETLQRKKATLPVENCPDLAPVLMAYSALFHGVRLTGTHRLKIKESDRGRAMAEELEKCGVNVVVFENEIDVTPVSLHAPENPVCSHNDHRIAMAMSVVLSKTGGVIEGAEAVKKSFPDYFERLKAWKVKVSYEAE